MNNSIELTQIGSYDSGIFDEGAAEITAYDSESQALYVINGANETIDILDISDPTNPNFTTAIEIAEFGDGINSIAIQDGVIAAAFEGEAADDLGTIVFFDTEGNVLNQVTVGALPDMVTFTPDGTKILVANEGEPDEDDPTINPEGSISIIDISHGVENATVTTADFTEYNGREDELRHSGVRIFPEENFANDAEPEFITVSPDSTQAFVSLQENNAIAVVDLETGEVTDIQGLGLKDYSLEGNGLDASDEDGGINIDNEPVFGLYQPDAIAAYEVDGEVYYVTANEGDARDEDERVEDLELDPHAFPNAEELQAEENLGRLEVSTIDGDTDGDGDYDQLVSYGGRSFSIRDAHGNLVFDSGDDFAQITAEQVPELFNSNGTLDSFDSRSDAKGAEPEGIVIGEIDGKQYAFVGLERTGGVMVYDISNPAHSEFVQYINPIDEETGDAADLAPEGLQFIPAEDSPNGSPLLTVSNEVSGTVSIYQIDLTDGEDNGDSDGDGGNDSDEDGTFTLQLLHAGDQEGGIAALEDAPNFSAVLNALRDEDADGDGVADYENTLTLSSGDAYIPGPFFAAGEGAYGGQGRGDILIQNKLGFQAIALGNHEFDLGAGTVADLISADEETDYPGANFPYLSSNLDFSTDEDLAPLIAEDGQEASEIPNSVTGSTIITVNGEQIGIIGATTPILGSISSPGDVTISPIEFDSDNPDDIAALAAEIQGSVDSLLADNPDLDKVVLLSHMQQISIEEALSSQLTDVDIIVAGGSNTLLADDTDRLRAGDESGGVYPILNTAADGNPVAIVNTGGNYEYVGRLVVEFDENGVIISESIDPNISGAYATDDEGVAAVNGTPDPEVVDITETLGAEIASQDGNIFGSSDVFLNGTREDVRTQETNLGNLTADANLALAQEVDSDVVISIKNGGGIRDNIGAVIAPPGSTDADDVARTPTLPNELAGKEAGDISSLDISNSLRFNNGLTLLTVTAAELLEIIEHGVAATADGETPGQFPQVAGIEFSFDASLASGDRVQSLAIKDEDGNIIDTVVEDGELVGDGDRTFRLVTLGFLADGGDDYPFPDRDRVDLDLEEEDPRTGDATFAPDGTEQDALAEYLFDNFNETPFDVEDVDPEDDTRIQNLAFRDDTVLDGSDVGDGNGNDDGSEDPTPSFEPIFGTTEGETIEITGSNGLVFAGGGDDLLDLSTGEGSNRVYGGSGSDTIILGENDRIFADDGDDRIFALSGGGNSINGNLGADQYWIANGEVPNSPNTINGFTSSEDVIGIAGLGIGYDDLIITQTDAGALISVDGNDLAIVSNTPDGFLSNPEHFVFA
ncbi:MAG: choice-of-anchor I family protein [Cyanobacteria bacterium P01_G01_bin.19]